MEGLDLLPPVLLLTSGLLIGIVVEIVVRAGLNRMLVRADESVRAAVQRAVRYRLLALSMLAGTYGAIVNTPRPAQIPASTWALLSNTLLALFIVWATVVTARLVDVLIGGYTRSPTSLQSSSILANLVRIFIIALGGLVLLQSLGVQVTPILTALGVGGLAVALALQDTLSNLFAGIYILVSRKLRPGDFVRMETGEEGRIQDINLRHTTLRELSDNMIIIPNTKLAASVNRNYDLPEPELAVLVDVGVSYNNDLERVEQVTVEVARTVLHEVPGGVPTFEPFIRFNGVGEFGVRFTTIMRAQQFTDNFLIKHEFIKRLHRRFEQEGIEWMERLPLLYDQPSNRER